MPREGTRQSRGYGAAHEAQRKAWEPRVKRGGVACAKCQQPIAPHGEWDLGHNEDRTAWTGPEHVHCNRRAGALLGHAKRASTLKHSRSW